MSVETITVEQLRDEVRRAVEETSARAMGRVVKLSASGLYNFINGQGRLYAPSKRRLTAWYLERRARAAHIPAPSADEVSAAVTLLLRDVEPGAMRLTMKPGMSRGFGMSRFIAPSRAPSM